MIISKSNTWPDAGFPSALGTTSGQFRRRVTRFTFAFLKFVCALTLIALAGIHTKAFAQPQLNPVTRGDIQPQPQLQLKLNPVTRGDMVVIGDLFRNAGPAALFPAFSAPKPGQSVYVDTANVAAAAAASGFEWQPPKSISRILVTREGTPVPINDIIEAVRDEFVRRGIDDPLEIEIRPRKSTFYVPVGAETDVIVEGLNHEIRNGGFVARLYIPGALPGDQRVKVPGRVRVIKEIPVLARRVAVGDKITELDLRWIEIATNKMGRGVIQEAHELIGQSPRRSLRPGMPIRYRDVQKPRMVTKGKLIKLIVQTPFMHISTTGKAMDSGALGDTIRVQNSDSRQIVMAIVDAHNRAYIPTGKSVAVVR